MLLEFAVGAGVVYLVGSGKVSDVRSAARVVGAVVGRAAGAATRLRLQADRIFASAAASNPELRASSAALQEKFRQLRTVSAQAQARVSIRDFLAAQGGASGGTASGGTASGSASGTVSSGTASGNGGVAGTAGALATLSQPAAAPVPSMLAASDGTSKAAASSLARATRAAATPVNVAVDAPPLATQAALTGAGEGRYRMVPAPGGGLPALEPEAGSVSCSAAPTSTHFPPLCGADVAESFFIHEARWRLRQSP